MSRRGGPSDLLTRGGSRGTVRLWAPQQPGVAKPAFRALSCSACRDAPLAGVRIVDPAPDYPSYLAS